MDEQSQDFDTKSLPKKYNMSVQIRSNVDQLRDKPGMSVKVVDRVIMRDQPLILKMEKSTQTEDQYAAGSNDWFGRLSCNRHV